MTTIIDKLQKLVNHEKSARSVGNVAEAEAFAAKIASLLFTHKLSMSQVEIDREEIDEPVAEEDIDKPRDSWSATLATACAKSSFCRLLRYGNDTLRFVGRKSNRQAAIAMYQYLHNLGITLGNTALATWKRTDDYFYQCSLRPGVARTWKLSFLKGYAVAIHFRLESEFKSLSSQTGAGAALVYVDKEKAAIQAFVDQRYGKLVKIRASNSRTIASAYRQGQQAGSSVSLKSRAAIGA